MSPNEILLHIVNLFTLYLEELKTLPRTEFIHGEMTAYVETLEIIQMHNKTLSSDLDYVIQEKYKI